MRKAIVGILVVLLVGAGNAWAQRLTGSLSVQVTDPAGKAVSDVKGTVVSKGRGNTVDVMSNADGQMVVPDLPPGDYKITLERDGFRTINADVAIRVGVTTSLDLTLELGSQASTVMVEANDITVDTDKSTVQGTIQADEIQSLPLNGRNFLDLAQLAPGVQVLDGGSFDPTKNQFVGVSIGGRSGRSTRIQVDGVDITDETVGTTVMNLTNESIQEFGIAQSSLDVSTDLTSTGAVNIITRSGTNQFHGSGFGFFRRSEFAANNGQLDELNPAKPAFSRDDYGGRLGGPFIKNKLFWEAEYEKQQQAGQITASEPAFTGFGGSFAVPESEHLGGGRLDLNLTNNQHLFYRFTHDDNIGVTGFGGVGFSAFANKNSSNAHSVGWDYTKGRFTNAVRFSSLKFVNGIVDANALAGTPTTVDPAGDVAQINITGLGGFVYGPNANAPQATYQQNRQIKYDGSATFGRHTLQFGVEYNRIDEAGFASFFGLGPRVRARFSQGVAAIPFNSNGDTDPLNYTFSSVFEGNGLGAGSEQPALGLPNGGFHNNRFGVYVHDTWKVSRTFTLNGGLRYDRDDGLTNHNLPRAPLVSSFDSELGQTPRNDNSRIGPQVGFSWNVRGDGKTVIRGGGGIYYETNIFNNILFDRTVNLAPGLGNSTPLITSSNPFLLDPRDGSHLFDFTQDCTNAQPGAGASQNSCFGASIGAATPFAVQAEQAFIAASAELAANYPPPGVPPQFNLDRGVIGGDILDPHYKSPYGVQVNIGVQRQIRNGLVLSVDYVMNRGIHFNQVVERNRIGAANTLNVAAANAAITRTLGDFGCPDIDCVITAGGTIDDFANEGLGAGSGVDGFAFSGKNPNFRQVFVIEPDGQSRYQGLQVALTGRLGTFGPFRHATTNITYALSRFKTTAVDQDFLSASINNDIPTQFYGPGTQDRHHQLGVAFITELPWHFRFSTTSQFRTNQPSSVFLNTSGGASDIFFSDLNGDGTTGDPLPGTSRGSFGRDFGPNGLNKLINAFDTNIAGTLTPAGDALVSAGLFSADQLTSLGAVISPVDPAPSDQKNNPRFFTTDIRLSWRWRVKEHLEIEPSVDCFNIWNKNNVIGPAGPLDPTLSGAPGSINGTTSFFTRVGAGSGSFSSGQPRAFQFGIRVSF
ncbi:MAG: TonB-dependent receptor [Acidobacteriota bacterium]|nr:TonB-dependent receptor [Acidobacteriota bacterium]